MKKSIMLASLFATTLFVSGLSSGDKVTICHYPPGNPANVQIISISTNALDTHIAQHGDCVQGQGLCFGDPQTLGGCPAN